MTLQLNVELAGTADVLSQLGKIENRFRTAALREMRDALGPMVKGAQGFVPSKPPVSGMARGYLAWDSVKVRNSIRAKVNERRKGSTTRIASIWLSTPEGGLFDMAGKASGVTPAGKRLIQALTSRYGPPSRVMWRARAVFERETNLALLQARDNMEKTLNDLLGRDR